jgi:hypothetical protein
MATADPTATAEQYIHRLAGYIEKSKRIESLIDVISGSIRDLHRSHGEMWALLNDVRARDQSTSIDASLFLTGFQQGLPYIQNLRSGADKVRDTSERAIERVRLWEQAVLREDHYSEKLDAAKSHTLFQRVLHPDRQEVDWFSRNEWKLGNAGAIKQKTERAMKQVDKYLDELVLVDLEECMQWYAKFLSNFSGSIFFDQITISPRDKYLLISKLE